MQPDSMGPWKIEKKIGAGGMGTVYLGEHEKTGQLAAVKVLPPNLARDEGFVERFSREVSSMQSLTNPYIVEFYDSGHDNDTYYYAMEYVEGETVTQILMRDKRIPWQQVVEYAIQICSALKAAHDAGIIHRDLKPSNLLIDKSGVIKLTDFGVAQVFAAGKLTITGGIIGTAEYMSPEQAQGQRATKKSDLYSLGAVMYVMIAGRPPFTGKTTIDIIQKHKFGQFDRPNMYVPEIPLWLNDLICQLLEKEPDKRFPDAYVLSRKLQSQYERHLQKLADATQAGGGTEYFDDTLASNDDIAGANDPNATLMRDLVKAQIEQQQEKGVIGNLLDNTLVLILLLGLLIWGGFYALNNTELTPEEMFAAGTKLLEQPEGSGWSRAKREYFEPLLESDPDRWSEKVLPQLAKIEEYEATRPSLRRRLSVNSADSEPLRLLQLADHYRSVGDYQEARRILQSLSHLVPDDEEHQGLRLKLDKRLELLDGSQAEQSDWQEFIQSSVATAHQSFENGDAQKARAICESLIALYGDDPLAVEAVRAARELLNRLPEN